ncbi:DNA-processing protein DprA [Bifidobacterium scaligerum]|uniref:DNA-processing protein DprA n=1 Tax=Bifidobacterium scaligerum TaxID=2052656 RepID=A0A2M9HSJ2_9BIFI|nr:DNA-processing protein DprA [Bifidobacterium scaligerum]PJM79785.1 DNA-processing protein DprA [Bifidobacterium scaligerum]
MTSCTEHPVTESAHINTVTPPSREALHRAALTFCLDGSDVRMFATLKGAPNAEALWHILEESHPDRSDTSREPALMQLDRMFAQGLVRWGRKASLEAMCSFRRTVAAWHNRMSNLPSHNITQLADWFTLDGTQHLIAPSHPCWPAQLNDLSIRADWAPPLCLWIKGNPAALVSCPKPIGIVGSRDVTEYGRYIAGSVAGRAAAGGHLVVSGGAMGTDAAAHWGALNATLGKSSQHTGTTVAVFAGGLNHIGPARNHTLFERIEEQHGALISELCPDTIPEARRFLLRNRIIAAMSSTLVVAQARLRSGALNTAGWACELMREVYAAPGNINLPDNAGCNKIIDDHQAMMLRSLSDIEEIWHEAHPPYTPQPSSVGNDAIANIITEDSSMRQTISIPSDGTSTVQTSDMATSGTEANRCRPDQRDAVQREPTRRESARSMPDLRETSRGQTQQQAEIKVRDLPEMDQLMVALMRKCSNKHLNVTPDALLREARQFAPDDIPDISAVLELLGGLELRGIVERKAGIFKLSSHVR